MASFLSLYSSNPSAFLFCVAVVIIVHFPSPLSPFPPRNRNSSSSDWFLLFFFRIVDAIDQFFRSLIDAASPDQTTLFFSRLLFHRYCFLLFQLPSLLLISGDVVTPFPPLPCLSPYPHLFVVVTIVALA